MHEYDRISDEALCVLGEAVGEDNIALFEPMSAHTTFRIGGPADVVCAPTSRDAVVRALDVCAKAGVPVTVVGNGSDLLVGDRGIRGVVLLLREGYSRVEVEGTKVHAEAGALLRDVAIAAADAELTGMEPLWGIPATVGGACHMNAGAYDSCTADVLESVEVYVPGAPFADGSRGRGMVRTYAVGELAMGYRQSRIHDEGLVVLSATFSLAPGNACMIRTDMETYRTRREEKQPLEMASAGSTFKRPAGHFAGKLIMDAGLAGARVGDAEVSTKHCGFVVNTGHATASDVCCLIEHIQEEVKSRFGVELEPEVKRVGEF